MKSFTQIVLPLVIVMALIGGVTFLAHYAGSQPRTNKRPTVVEDDAASEARDLVEVGAADEEDGPAIVLAELHRPGQQYCWLKNVSSAPLELTLKGKSTDCERVAAITLNAEQWQELNRQAARLGVAWVGESWQHPVNLLTATANGWAMTESAWFNHQRPQTFDEPSAKALRVPAGSPEQPAFAVVRLDWTGAEPGPSLVRAEFWVAREHGPRQRKTVERKVAVLPAIQAAPGWAQFKDLTGRGQRETVSYTCWSPTRGNLRLQARDARDHAAFACVVEPLTEVECRNVAQDQKSPVRSGCRVYVSVTESESLDLGPFSREIVLRGEADDTPVIVRAYGVVRGPVKVGTPAEPDVIDLGNFPTRKGVSRSVPVVLQGSDGKVTVDSWSPDYLGVKLDARPAEPDAQRWELTVAVPGGAAVGKLPPASTVFLKVHGATPRRLRIPVLGQGTQ
ncbi:MAG: hypothetical protein JNM56_39530 [Planctomycetia bacterium]|nr:hypothetical protein [Planctomycetia bacterium]